MGYQKKILMLRKQYREREKYKNRKNSSPRGNKNRKYRQIKMVIFTTEPL